MRKTSIIIALVLIATILLVSSTIYFYGFETNKSLSTGYVIGVVSGTLSSIIVSILLLWFDVIREKDNYKRSVVLHLIRLSSFIRNRNYSGLINNLWYSDSPFHMTREQFKYDKKLQKIINSTKECISDLNHLASICYHYDIDFESKNDEFDAMNDKLRESIDNIYNDIGPSKSKI